jgi:hypothetical protein
MKSYLNGPRPLWKRSQWKKIKEIWRMIQYNGNSQPYGVTQARVWVEDEGSALGLALVKELMYTTGRCIICRVLGGLFEGR